MAGYVGNLTLARTATSRQDVLMRTTRHILVLALDGCQSLDVLGPVEVFDHASIEVPGAYQVELIAPTDNDTVTMSSGVRVGVAPLPEPPPRHDTLVIAGGAGAREGITDLALLDWITRASRRARRTVSICTGAYLLAAAGLLDDRRATTHWEYCDALATTYTQVQVEPDPVFIRDGDVWTSAGITAGIDLTLALVEDDLGPNIALAVARQLVVFLKRPGGQSQFSSALSAQQAARPELRELQAWIAGHLDEDLSVSTLADRAIMSERSFARAFSREVGQTPGRICRSAPDRARPRPARNRRTIARRRRPIRRVRQHRSPPPRIPPTHRHPTRRLPRPLPSRPPAHNGPRRPTARSKRTGLNGHPDAQRRSPNAS